MAEEAAIIAEELGETLEKNETLIESDVLNSSILAQHSQDSVLQEDTSSGSNNTFYQPVWILDKVLGGAYLVYNCITRSLETTVCPMPTLDRQKLHCDAGSSPNILLNV